MHSGTQGVVLALCAVFATVGQAATPFDTAGPFVAYGIGTTAYVNGTDWVHVANGAYLADAQGGVGIAKAAVQRTSGSDIGFIWSGWNDTVTFTSASALAGTLGTVSFRLDYAWSAQVAGTSFGQAYVDVNLRRIGTGGGPASQYAEVGEDITRSCSVAGQCGGLFAATSPSSAAIPTPTFANGVATFTLNVVFGQSYTMVLGMNVEVDGGDGAMTIDATHSLHWGGITAVTAAGVPVAYQVAAGSGFNYTAPAPVPEAPTWALWGVGSLLLGAGAARRNQRA